MRVATWNIDRSGIRQKGRIEPQLSKLASIDADILVLTETHESVRPKGYDYHVASRPEPGYHLEGESCVTIWSRYKLRPIDLPLDNPYLTVCAEIHEPLGAGIIVYGTIITYGADGVREGLAKPWERHRAAVKSQTAEWMTLRQRYPKHIRIVAGDFNENLDGKRWYGVNDAKLAIHAGLVNGGLQCPTAAERISLVTGENILSRSSVDHICVSESNAKVLSVLAWDGTDGNTALSDHNGVVVDIERTLEVICIDADIENADWTKRSWDLPAYKSSRFNELVTDLEVFRELPVYKHAVEQGLIVDDEWVGPADDGDHL